MILMTTVILRVSWSGLPSLIWDQDRIFPTLLSPPYDPTFSNQLPFGPPFEIDIISW